MQKFCKVILKIKFIYNRHWELIEDQLGLLLLLVIMGFITISFRDSRFIAQSLYLTKISITVL